MLVMIVRWGSFLSAAIHKKRRIQRMRPWVLLSLCTGTIGFLFCWFVDFNIGEVELNFKKVLLPGPSQNQQAQEPSQEVVAETWKKTSHFDKGRLNWDQAANDAPYRYGATRLGS